jgi:hypothetical protein
VTREVREKLAQNVAQAIFVKFNAFYVLWEKVAQKIRATSVFFKKCPKSTVAQ